MARKGIFAGFSLARDLAKGVFVVAWSLFVFAVGDGLYTWTQRSYDDPFDNGAWLAMLLLGVFTVLLTEGLGLALEEWPRASVLQLVPPVILLALTVLAAAMIPARQPHAGKVALEFEAVAAVLYTAATARSCWRRRGGDRLARARVRR